MKVKDLKKSLEELPDDLDVKMLLPLVDDWADIKLKNVCLYRMKKDVRSEVINRQNEEFFNKELGQDRKTDYTPEDMPDEDWKLYNGFVFSSISQEDFYETYETKEALVISNKTRGKTDYDRNGTIEY
jgi:hypothetical protein